MYILAIKRRSLRKNAVTMLGISLGAFLFDKIYALFAHGVQSPFMTYLFLFPLLGGTVFYMLLNVVCPSIPTCRHYRLFTNLYNSGIAALSVGSLLRGIFDIAGTASHWVTLYTLSGWGMMLAGVMLLLFLLWDKPPA